MAYFVMLGPTDRQALRELMYGTANVLHSLRWGLPATAPVTGVDMRGVPVSTSWRRRLAAIGGGHLRSVWRSVELAHCGTLVRRVDPVLGLVRTAAWLGDSVPPQRLARLVHRTLGPLEVTAVLDELDQAARTDGLPGR